MPWDTRTHLWAENLKEFSFIYSFAWLKPLLNLWFKAATIHIPSEFANGILHYCCALQQQTLRKKALIISNMKMRLICHHFKLIDAFLLISEGSESNCRRLTISFISVIHPTAFLVQINEITNLKRLINHRFQPRYKTFMIRDARLKQGISAMGGSIKIQTSGI